MYVGDLNRDLNLENYHMVVAQQIPALGIPNLQEAIRRFPKTGDPNLVPQIVGSS